MTLLPFAHSRKSGSRRNDRPSRVSDQASRPRIPARDAWLIRCLVSGQSRAESPSENVRIKWQSLSRDDILS